MKEMTTNNMSVFVFSVFFVFLTFFIIRHVFFECFFL